MGMTVQSAIQKMLSKNWVRILLIALFVAGLACVAEWHYAVTWLLSGQIYYADDVLFHLNRIQSIADGLRGGQFPVALYPNANMGFGYASPLFYPELFLYFPALLVLFGMPVLPAFCLFCWAINVGMFCSIYCLAGKYKLSRSLRVLAGCVYFLSQYVASDIMLRAALGEAIALVFLPVVFTGLYNMVKEGFSKPWILLLGLVGITYSHTISLVFAVIAVIAVLLCNAKALFFDRMWWRKVGFLAVAYLLLAAAFYVPFLIMLMKGRYVFMGGVGLLPENAFSLIDLADSLYGVGPFALLLLLARLFLQKTPENAERVRTIDFFWRIQLLLLFLTSKLFPWKLLNPILGSIQFPWRLNGIFCIFFSLYTVLLVPELVHSARLGRAVLVILALCLACYNVNYLGYDKYTQFNYNALGQSEWLPEQAVRSDDSNLYDGAGNPISYSREQDSVTIVFTGEENEEYTLPLCYYYGYEAKVQTSTGSYALPCDSTSDGRVHVRLSEAGRVTVCYSAPVAFTVAWCVSAVTAVACTAAGIILRKKKYLENNEAAF